MSKVPMIQEKDQLTYLQLFTFATSTRIKTLKRVGHGSIQTLGHTVARCCGLSPVDKDVTPPKMFKRRTLGQVMYGDAKPAICPVEKVMCDLIIRSIVTGRYSRTKEVAIESGSTMSETSTNCGWLLNHPRWGERIIQILKG
ncbi:hypothetical protein PInf_022761 [Phytophthora infestans]|nr:hypothetical protein PInf_022761 [Phytophthora infestans]